MGPRRYRRGNPAYPPQERRAIALQWGHDVTVAEIGACRILDLLVFGASMGPRRYRRGNRENL